MNVVLHCQNYYLQPFEATVLQMPRFEVNKQINLIYIYLRTGINKGNNKIIIYIIYSVYIYVLYSGGRRKLYGQVSKLKLLIVQIDPFQFYIVIHYNILIDECVSNLLIFEMVKVENFP